MFIFLISSFQLWYFFIIPASIMVAGSCTGAICGGIQSEKFGRRKSLLLDCFIYIVGTILFSVAPNFYVLLVARVILGHSTASAMTTTSVYTRFVKFCQLFVYILIYKIPNQIFNLFLSEISQPEVRTITGCFFTPFFIFGTTFQLVLGKGSFKKYVQ